MPKGYPKVKPGSGASRLAASQHHIAVALRQRRALELRMLGHSYRRIAALLNAEGFAKVSFGMVVKDVTKELKNFQLTTTNKVEELRALEDARLDYLILQLQDKLLAGDVQAVSVVVRIAERRAKLWGLDQLGTQAKGQLQEMMEEMMGVTPDETISA